MANWFETASLAKKLRTTAMGTVLVVLTTSFYLIYGQYQQGLSDKRQAMQEQVQSALSILKWLSQKAEHGEMPVAQAQAQALETLRNLRQGDNGYVFVLDAQSHMKMNPVSPDLEGKDMSNEKDANGFLLFQALGQAALKPEGGSVSYRWIKPSTKQDAAKEAFVKQFVPWGWTVGTGMYLDDLQAVYRTRALMYLPVALLGAVLLWVVLHAMGKSMTVRLARMRDLAQAIAQGDISRPIKWRVQDEIGEVMGALKTMCESLNHTMGQVRHSVDSMATASREIAVGSHDLSQRTEQTAARLQETAASVGLLHYAVRDNTDASRSANQLASGARQTAQQGNEVVSQVVLTMDEIQASSRKITDIIAVIDGIAFQTNILALNAAVEAARAGEQGKGFAVVANEVRTLAGRSAEAAKEIKSLIANSTERVESGSRLVQDAGSAMLAILQSVEQVDQTISRIANSATEQAQGIGHVNQAVSHLDEMTQQNAALVEQSAAAASSMEEQTGKLTQAVGWFKLAA